MDSFELIESYDELCRISDALKWQSQIGVDTESDGFHSYFEKLCLIQVSTSTCDIIIDPLVINDLTPLQEVLENPNIKKILHASSNDILAFQRDYGYRLRNLFDTAFAWSLLGHRRCGLAYVLQKEFQVEHPKKSKYQRCNWAIRPLREDQLEYARLDTHHLIPLRHRLEEHLFREGLQDKAIEGFNQLEGVTFEPKKPDPNAYLKIKGAKELDCKGKHVLKALCRFRDRVARNQNRSPFRIMTNESMLRLARTNPQSIEDLLQITGLPKHFKEHQANGLLAVIQRANNRLSEFSDP
ncbi:MAG: HRDC domain-containing protein [Thermodesulfobacteriota bacterium]|nr:HRDC domain-containing protein [Thermodesulfobacteriota bacterium]